MGAKEERDKKKKATESQENRSKKSKKMFLLYSLSLDQPSVMGTEDLFFNIKSNKYLRD